MKRDGTEFGGGGSFSRYWLTFTILTPEEKVAIDSEPEEMKTFANKLQKMLDTFVAALYSGRHSST